MAASPAASSLALSHVSSCDCDFCQTKPIQNPEQVENLYIPNGSNVRTQQDQIDYFSLNNQQSAPKAESTKMTEDQRISQAPYLPKVQIWARSDGPYTLKVGNQWFHCDDLVINGSEYRKAKKPSSQPVPASGTSTSNQSVYPPQRSRRPMAERSQSYNRTRPEKKAGTTTTVTPVTPSPPPATSSDKLAASNQYQPQALPTPKEQAERRRHRRRHEKDNEAPPRASDRERDQISSSPRDSSTYGALVKYSAPPTTDDAAPKVVSTRPARPGPPRRGSSRNNSYQIPVRKPGKKNVRFALPN